MNGQIITNQHGIALHRGGRRRPLVTAETHPHLFRGTHLYMKAQEQEAPDFDYFAACREAESDILANDLLGDCTSAGALHLTEAFTANANNPVVFTRDDAIRFYSLATNYNPADPSTDQGGDEIQVCSTWRDKGLDGNGSHKILGWLTIDTTTATPSQIKWLGWVFEGYYFGLELDKSWPDQVSGDGFQWLDGTPDPTEGHCIVGAKATGTGDSLLIGVNSWGFLGSVGVPVLRKFCSAAAFGNLFIVFTQEIIDRAKAKAPNGFAYDDLLADFQAFGGASTLAASVAASRVSAQIPAQMPVQAPVKIPAPPAVPSDVGPPSSSPTIEAKDMDEEKGPSTQPAGAGAPLKEPEYVTMAASHYEELVAKAATLSADDHSPESLQVKAAIDARVAGGETPAEAQAWVAMRLETILKAAEARYKNRENPRHTHAFVAGKLHMLVHEANGRDPVRA